MHMRCVMCGVTAVRPAIVDEEARRLPPGGAIARPGRGCRSDAAGISPTHQCAFTLGFTLWEPLSLKDRCACMDSGGAALATDNQLEWLFRGMVFQLRVAATSPTNNR